MKLSIFGLGYVGAVSLGCLARDGHQVIGVDMDHTKLDLIRAGNTPVIETGMQALIANAVGKHRAEVTDDTGYAVAASDVSFVCVGTPARPNGSQDLAAIERLTAQLGGALREKSDRHLFVVRSTVFPGTTESAVTAALEEHSGKKSGRDFDVCFQPEFLREGSSIKDYDNPPYTVVGCDSERVAGVMRDLFAHLPCAFIRTSVRTAETMKYACNIFHAVKITFANEIGRLAQSMGVDSHEVMDIVCRDTHLNISPAYLKPGFAFGGSCLPKDLKAMLYVAKSNDVSTPMLSGLMPSNQVHIDHAIDMVLESGRRKVGMIGLSFKSGTDDLRESPLVTMAKRFIGEGIDLRIYDPEVYISRLVGANRRYIEETIPHIASLMTDDRDALVDDSQVVVVGLSDRDAIDAVYERGRGDQLVLDLVGLSNRHRISGQYLGVCW